jgi:hypothetical protein
MGLFSNHHEYAVPDKTFPQVTAAPTPAPAVTILPPQHIPGSAASANKTDKDFAPAPAPVVVTTAPLPTITPDGSSVATKPLCCNSITAINTQVQSTWAVASILPFAIIGVGILTVIAGVLGSPGGTKRRGDGDSATTGILSLIVAVGGMLLALYIMAVVIGSLSYSMNSGMLGCVPC